MDERELDYNKMKQNSEKIGYRDGIEEGRKSNFQSSFDNGYRSGFKNGFALGKLKGTGNVEICPTLEYTKRGNCCICKDAAFMDKPNEAKDFEQWNFTMKTMSSNCL